MIDKELEQAAQEHQDKFYFSEPSPASSFVSGGNWVKERMFTFDEMIQYASYCITTGRPIPKSPNEWKELRNL